MKAEYLSRWTPEADATLRALWAEGLTAKQIAEKMATTRWSLSRNAVLGRVHRLKLPSRPSPIKRPAKPPSMLLINAAPRDCRWPIGEPREGRICGRACVNGGPYCREHHAMAYTGRSVLDG